MEFLNRILWAVQLLLLIGLSSTVKSQQALMPKSVSQASFKSLSLDEQRKLAYMWVNASDTAMLPVSVQLAVEDHYKAHGMDVVYSRKYLNWLKPLYNHQIPILDRINFCHFLMTIFTDEELPMVMVHEEKNRLITKIRE